MEHIRVLRRYCDDTRDFAGPYYTPDVLEESLVLRQT